MAESPDPELLLDLVDNKVAVLDGDGIYRHLNATTADTLGFRPDELVGTDAFALVHPDDAEQLRAEFTRIIAGGRPPDEPIEYRYQTADGDWVWLRTRVHLPDETGVDGYVLISRDVTAEVESQRRLETIASASSDVFWMFSADWETLLFINHAVADVFGVGPDALKRQPSLFLDAVHPDDVPYVERAMERLSNGEPTQIDYRLGSADGVTKWVRVSAEPVAEDGEVTAVTGFARDVTDEYRRERQLAVMDNLLRHTIRNDMNIVDGTAEQIADRIATSDALDPEATASDSAGDGADADDGAVAFDPEALTELCGDIREHAETIRRVASDLLTTAEKQRGVIDLLRQRGSPRSVEIAPVVEDALGMVVDDCAEPIHISYRESAGDRGESRTGSWTAGDETAAGAAANGDSPRPRVSVSYPPNARAFTHPELDYAIAELVENALEHAESTPRIRIGVCATTDAIKVSIRDNCPPIPVEERYVITDRWEMDDLRHTGGMGLWLVYWVANRSGGDLTFDTHADGNVVTLSVPNANGDATEGHREYPSAQSRPRTVTVGEPKNRIRTDGPAPSTPEQTDETD